MFSVETMSHCSTFVEVWTDLPPVCFPSLINASPSCQGPAPCWSTVYFTPNCDDNYEKLKKRYKTLRKEERRCWRNLSFHSFPVCCPAPVVSSSLRKRVFLLDNVSFLAALKHPKSWSAQTELWVMVLPYTCFRCGVIEETAPLV